MKKLTLSLLATVFAFGFSYAQNTLPTTGNVGIGTTTPAYPLDVAFNSRIGAGGDKFNTPLTLIKNGDAYGIDYPVFIIKHSGTGVNTFGNPATDLGIIQITGFNTNWANKSINSNNNFFVFTNGTAAVNTDKVPGGYNFAVNGKVIATAITVQNYANWPDYVFKPTYKLRPLSEVKAYIDQNQHLPEVPAAATVEKEGMDVAEMNKILLKKVEELTLYLIEKDKEVKQLKEAVAHQQDQLSSLIEKKQ